MLQSDQSGDKEDQRLVEEKLEALRDELQTIERELQLFKAAALSAACVI